MINYISSAFRWFFKLEAASGLLLLISAVCALIISNSSFSSIYFEILESYFFIGVNNIGIKLSLLHWINDALMAIFFFFVTLEIKREFIDGELSNRKQALLPIIAALWILIAVFTGFFTSHWVFRWRTAMANYYHDQWLNARLTEGASQRVQEDTLKFARIMEGLGTGLLDSVMTLIAFTPILWGLSKQIDKLPWIGQVDHALVWVAIISALGGTILLAAVGIKLPGIEYDIQKEEAGYRKELVHGEDDPIRAAPPTIGQLYNRVRGIHYKSYFHYLYFNTVKWSYFQGMVVVPYLALAPTIVTGAITLGFVQQITRAFGRVESSLQYLVKSWSTIVELISVWKRLKEFEAKLNIEISKTVFDKSS